MCRLNPGPSKVRTGRGREVKKGSAVVMVKGLVTFKKPDLLGQPCPEFPAVSGAG